VVKKVRISSRKASSSGDSCNRIGPHFLTATLDVARAVSTCTRTIPYEVPAGNSGRGVACTAASREDRRSSNVRYRGGCPAP
jgi:hypothetical protein